ncbi:hypothetical protein HLB44_07470 [Aquincola sp. S2]|uniref:Uncharacterized protein n=1 Tax=Pseudaquabacterium terrae TaxID=2732868 RepID=A0ABX2EDY0_9BURK|nr:hypothetical protein [Aquabacterium terrae]NRF66818.1 hypothetical protein [Aquabacterium terrae]
MKKLLLAVAALTPLFAHAAVGDQVIANSSNTVSVQTWATHAGAVVGLFFKDAQGNVFNFVNNSDHGRDIQMAVTLDGYCEALNPTEAGRANDGSSPSTTSAIGSMSLLAPNKLYSSVHPAYWLSPGQAVGTQSPGCTPAPGGIAVNSTAVSSDVMYKVITVGIGANDLQKVVMYQSSLTSANARTMATWQVPALYLIPEFTHFEKYTGTSWTDMAQGAADPTTSYATEFVANTIMVSNAAGTRAVGVWSPGSSMVGARYLSGITSDPTTTITANKFLGPFAAGQTLNAVSYFVVGTRAEVQRIMTQSVIGQLY